MELPLHVYITRKDVLSCGAGITRHQFDKAVRSGALGRHVFPGCSYGKYKRVEVVRVFGLRGGKDEELS